MKPSLAIALLLCTACSSQSPFASTKGTLPPGSIISVSSTKGEVDVYTPAVGDPLDQFAVEAFAPREASPAAPAVRHEGTALSVVVRDPLARLIVRAPDKVNVVVENRSGDVNVTNVTGFVDVRTGEGSVRIMVPGVAQAQTGRGDLNVTFGALEWPGTLRFENGDGDVELWVNENAKFRVRLHTDNGTLFSDFGLRGTSAGASETIQADVNGGAGRRIEIETRRGSIRLLRLAPQA